MKKIIFFLFAIAFIYSCSPAKIVSISSENVPVQNNQYVFENDTIKITYSFWADKGIMKFNIYNKINEPLYFDWKNSAYIPNSEMVSYWQDETNSVGSYASSTTWFYGVQATSSKMAAKSIHKERIGVIPPHSLITRMDYKLAKSYYDIPNPGSFTKNNSNLFFRNYLMYCTNEKFEGVHGTVDNAFYISNVQKTTFGKKDQFKSETKFYVKKQ
ncbi:MAG: hypothetical protein JST87_05520 [Bacteroidetes bacterium]|nr:hypothetical protein [Bacteroidota bacterium]